jgi:hypothetical protein
MAEHEAQTGSDGPAMSDETLRLYLLCRLEEDERLELDERLLVDNQLAERIVLVESELTDDYVAGRLDTVERAAFSKRFLVTEGRKRQLHFTSALQDYSRSQAAAPVSVITQRSGPAWRERIAGLFSPNRPAWAFAGSLAVLLLLIGLTWFVVKQRRETQGLMARHEPIPTSSPQASPQVVASPAISSVPQPTPGQKTPVVPAPSEPAVRPTIASLVLPPGAIRGGGDLPRIALPDGERDIVRLSLVLEAVAEGTYQAELLTAEGQAVTARSKLKVDTRNAEARVVLDIPARLLHNGDYQIKLSRQKVDGQLETVGRYYFRALD